MMAMKVRGKVIFCKKVKSNSEWRIILCMLLLQILLLVLRSKIMGLFTSITGGTKRPLSILHHSRLDSGASCEPVDHLSFSSPQIITAGEMVSRVSNLTSLSTFGFSLQGGVDVDNNQYRGTVLLMPCFRGS